MLRVLRIQQQISTATDADVQQRYVFHPSERPYIESYANQMLCTPRVPAEHAPVHVVLCMIDDSLAAVHSGAHNKRTAVIAYPDDVTIILRSPKDIQIVQEALRCYEDASGAKLNVQKSKAMALGSWNTSHNIMGIPYHNELRILRIKMVTTIHQSAINSWRKVIVKIRA